MYVIARERKFFFQSIVLGLFVEFTTSINEAHMFKTKKAAQLVLNKLNDCRLEIVKREEVAK